MDDAEVALEILTTRDASIVTDLLKQAGIEVQQPGPSRFLDPLTAIGIAAATVKLINALIDLSNRLRQEMGQPPATLRNLAGTTLDLAAASPDAIRQFVEAAAAQES
jgi:hypothetical protein